MSEQVSTPQRPSTNDPDAWRAYWRIQGWPWRTEPEIDAERQKYLAERRAIVPDIEEGIYPFKDIKLNRADIEWLLATHDNGRGPVDWSDESQREREGLDLRGADLQQENLSDLPLARMRGGLANEEWSGQNKNELTLAAVNMEAADLTEAKLQGATLRYAELGEAKLFHAWLQKALLLQANLQHSDLLGANLQESNLCLADLESSDLYNAQLQGANLNQASLHSAGLGEAQLQGGDLRGADLGGGGLKDATFSDEENGTARLADVDLGNANLAVVDWEQVKKLGDEEQARQKRTVREKQKRKIRGYLSTRRLLVLIASSQLHYKHRA